MLQKARDRGADRFELFSNSPVWWMLYNLNPAGRGTSDNLRAGAALVHAMYLAKVIVSTRAHMLSFSYRTCSFIRSYVGIRWPSVLPTSGASTLQQYPP